MYDFLNLSPIDFEELIRDLLQAELFIRLESFGPGQDWGIDFRHSAGSRHTIVQAKHYGRSGVNKLIPALEAENNKIAALGPLVKRYIIATSASLSPAVKERIVARMQGSPIARDDIFGLEDLNNVLNRHPSVEKQHFKLWMSSTTILERILLSGVYNRTQTELAVIRDMVPLFVQNQSLVDAEAILGETGSLIISGQPGVGKSTLARMLVWLHAAQGWRIFVVDEISEAFEVANEGEKRLILFDDFLGQVQLSPDFVRGIDQRLPPFLDRVSRNKNLRFVLTTRDYILSQAQALGGKLASTKIDSKRYVLNVGSYTRGIRARILYNHIYFSDLSEDERNALLTDDFYLKIIDHKNFNPRLVQALTNSEYSIVANEPIREAVDRILNNPRELWDRPYKNHITEEGRALMLALLFNGPTVPIRSLELTFIRVANALELKIAKTATHTTFRNALRELEGSVIAIVERSIRFSNPGVRDYLQTVVVEDEVLLPIVEYLEAYSELRPAWNIWHAANTKSAKSPPSEQTWTGALKRMFQTVGEDTWPKLQLAINVYEVFQTDAALNLVRAALENCSDHDFSLNDVREAHWALETSGMHSLPIDELVAVRRLATIKSSELLISFGKYLSLDDIDTLDTALHDYGDDPAIVEKASRAGLVGLVESIDSHLEDINSLEDLDVFESDLVTFMRKHDFENVEITRRVFDKRNQLYEEADKEDEENYSQQPVKPTNTEMTTEQIRSMFSGFNRP